MELGIAQGLLGFALYLGTVSLGLRLWARMEATFLVLAATGVDFFLTLAVLLVFGQSVNFWAFAVSYSFFVLCFLMAFGALYKSISLRILHDLSKKVGRAEIYDAVLGRYIAEESFQNRLIVILRNGLAVRVGDCFALTERGHSIAASMRAVQKAFGIMHSG